MIARNLTIFSAVVPNPCAQLREDHPERETQLASARRRAFDGALRLLHDCTVAAHTRALDACPFLRVTISDPAHDLTCHLVVDRLERGLCVGGVRLAPAVTPAAVQRLARLMSLKYRALGIPLGGAKVGIVQTHDGDRRALLGRAGQLLEPYLRSCFLASDDLGTRAGDIVEIYRDLDIDPLEVATARSREAGVELLPPPNLFDSRFAARAAGEGLAEALQVAAESRGLRLDRLSIAIQGFGTMGRAAARSLSERGAVLVAVADVEATVVAPHGLDLDDLEQACDAGVIRTQRLRRPVTVRPPDCWYQVPADVLVPAAVEDVITGPTVRHVNRSVKVLVEAANGPVSPDAEAALEARGVVVVPDLLANAGPAAAFGLLLTDQARGLDEALVECCRRIGEVTRLALGPRFPGFTARERALALAAAGFGSVSAPVAAADLRS